METKNYGETGIFPETIDTDADILPFRIDVQGHVLNDLKKRIAATRWIDEIPGAKWEYGTSEVYLKEALLEYWKTNSTGRNRNSTSIRSAFSKRQSMTSIHFIHQKGEGYGSDTFAHDAQLSRIHLPVF